MTGTRFNNGIRTLLVKCPMFLPLNRQHPPRGNLVGANYVTPLIRLRTGIPIPLPRHTPTFPCVLVSVIPRGASITIVLATGNARIKARRTLSAFGGALKTKQLNLLYPVLLTNRPSVP